MTRPRPSALPSRSARRRPGTSRLVSSPCMWSSRFEPARSCRSSTFWVTSSSSPGHSASSRASASMRGIGLDRSELRPPRVVEGVDQRRVAAERLGRATSSTRWPSHRPSGPRKVASPLSAETPAPVRMTMLRMSMRASIERRRDERRQNPHRHRRLDLPAVARRLLSRQAAAGEGARICVAAQLGAIEINATFYGRQSPKSWETWEKVAPDGFQFAVKGSRYCVMPLEARRSGEGLANFFAQGFAALGPEARADPVAVRAAPEVRPRRYRGFIDLLPEKLDGIALRHAIEPRHESFRDEKFFDLCRDAQHRRRVRGFGRISD